MIGKKHVLLMISAIICVFGAKAQEYAYDSSRTKMRKNIVRVNPTPTAIAGLESFAIGYERVIKDFQSVSVNIGALKFRPFLNFNVEQYGIDKNRSSGGIILAIDYRRYFKKRNRGFAPDGLYWGPFFTYYQYNHELVLNYTDPANLTTSSVTLEGNLQVRHLGVQLGYQFIIKKRLAIDLIFIGPSWGKYIADFRVGGNASIDQESELYEAIYELITDRVPGASALFEDQEVQKTGHFSTNTIGLRYVFQIGFLF